MPNIAAIDGITGPGRRTILISGEVTEVTFRLGKKVVEITNRDGSIGSYDLAQVEHLQVSTDGTDFTLAVTSKKDAEKRAEARDDRTSETRNADTSYGKQADDFRDEAREQDKFSKSESESKSDAGTESKAV
jgi:hypothetical protein